MINHNFKKKFGQNFLKDDNIIEKIIKSANLKEKALTIEIGPGSGALTKRLVENSHVIAYEIDTDLKDTLYSQFLHNEKIEIIFDDFLKRSIKKDIEKYDYNNLYVVANLPYYITTPIIEKIISENLNFDKIVIMVQKEVGERFSATVGSKDYSSITVFLNYYFNIKKEFIVSKNSFYPKPNVDSMVISFTKKENKLVIKNEEQFFKLIRDSFKYKRKTLKNNLKDYDFDKIKTVLSQYDYTDSVRAEQIPIEIFAEISNII